MPSLGGACLFADFEGDELGVLRTCHGVATSVTAVPLSQIPTTAGALDAITSILEGHDGELYVTWGFASHLGKLVPQ